MRNKVILWVFLGSLLTCQSANAKLIAINKNDRTDKFLIFVDFDKAKPVANASSRQVLLTMQSNPIDKQSKQFLDSSLPERFSKIWLTGEYIIDCDNKLITSQHRQVMGLNKNRQTINISQTYAMPEDDPSTRPIQDNVDNFVYEHACHINK